MQRPTTVKVAGIFLMVAGLLWVGILILSTYVVVHRGLAPTLQSPRFISFLATWGIVLAFSSWEIVTGIGILRLRAWARISIIALGVIAAYHFLGVVLAFPFLRGWGSSIGIQLSGAGLFLIYFGCGGLAALAIVVFASKRMDQVFRLPVTEIPSNEKAEATDLAAAGTRASLVPQRPLSALVIGAWLLCAGPLLLYQDLLHLQMIVVPLPSNPLGFSLRPRGETAYLVLMAAALVVLGFGLLRGDYYWARRGTIAFCIFSIVSKFATALRPGYAAHMAGELPTNTSMAHARIALWLLASWSVVPPAIALYLLAKRTCLLHGQPREAGSLDFRV